MSAPARPGAAETPPASRVPTTHCLGTRGPPITPGTLGSPAETVQYVDGITFQSSPYVAGSIVEARHGNRVLNGAFLDGHAGAIPEAEWDRVSRDARGYFYALAAADR